MIELIEYETSIVALDHAEAIELTALTRGSTDAKRRPRVIERLAVGSRAGEYEVKPGPYIGRFALHTGRVVDISSRFPFPDLTALLGLGRRATMLHEAAAPAAGGHGLMDAIALAFAREAERVAGQGLAKDYQTRTFTRPPYPGIPAAGAHLTAHAGRPDRLVTTAKRLTLDIPINRVLAQAHRRLSQLTYHDPHITTRLRALAPVFHPITAGDAGMAVVPARYRQVYDLARLVLDDRTALPTDAGLAGASVLFNMTKIWEAYVARWLADTVGPGKTVAEQYPIPLVDEGEARNAVADFVVLRSERPVAVYDAKYRPWQSWPSTDELYQLFTYASRLRLDRAALVHPAREARRSTTRIGDIVIDSLALSIIATADEPVTTGNERDDPPGA